MTMPRLVYLLRFETEHAPRGPIIVSGQQLDALAAIEKAMSWPRPTGWRTLTAIFIGRLPKATWLDQRLRLQ
jgi:hypothetical protein